MAVESDEEEDVSAEGNSLPMFQSRPPSIVVQDETGLERSGTDQHEKVEVLPIPIVNFFIFALPLYFSIIIFFFSGWKSFYFATSFFETSRLSGRAHGWYCDVVS